jgi:menaquinone-dependent protoporphyrinogen oxidase
MSRILVSYASRTGTTRAVATALGHELVRSGQDVDVLPCRQSPSAYHYDAVVLGSGVHRGHWSPDALDYLHAEAPDLGERPTWLFQTGPCGDGEVEGHVGGTFTPTRVLELVRDLGAAGPATFSRSEDGREADGSSRWVATGPCFGPFGSEDGVRSWAQMILDHAHGRPAPAGLEDELGGGAGPARQHLAISAA